MLSMPFNTTSIPGLYCVGDSTFPGQGVNAVVFSGFGCAHRWEGGCEAKGQGVVGCWCRGHWRMLPTAAAPSWGMWWRTHATNATHLTVRAQLRHRYSVVSLGYLLLKHPVGCCCCCRVAVDLGMEPGWPAVDKAYNALLNFVRDRS